MKPRFILSGLFLLVCGSFIDSSRGVLLPVLTEQFHLSYVQSSGVFIAGNIGSVVMTFGLLPLSHRFSEKRLALVTAAVGIVGLLLGFQITYFSTLMVFATFLGVAIAAYGALSNLFVIHGTDLNSRSKTMCGLHMIYGVTSISSPLICQWLLSQGVSWSGCLALVGGLLLGVMAFVWFKIPEEATQAEKVQASFRLSGLQRWAFFIFGLYITGEVLNSMWLVTYLVQSKSLSLSLSAKYLSCFFVVMTLTRGLCFLSFQEAQENRLLVGSLVFSLLFFCLGHLGYLWAFPMAGVLGPFFPVFLGRVSRVFHEQAKAVILWSLGMGYLTLSVFHLTVGKLAMKLGMDWAYWLPAVLIAASIGAFGVYLKKERSYLGGLH
jgi:fucose permease